MSKRIISELPELVKDGVITEDIANRIQLHYQSKDNTNKLVIIAGILGAILTGLGIILIIAHNWDTLSKSIKIFLAFLPLLIGQILCTYTILRKNESLVWRESSSVFLFFSIAASISIVSQVYNIAGDLPGFILIWMILTIPLIYIMRSGVTSLLVICGITWYMLQKSYFDYPKETAWYYLIMMAAVIPFLVLVVKMLKKNFLLAHMWLITISLLLALGMFSGTNQAYLSVGYMSLLSGYILLGAFNVFSGVRPITNAPLFLGNVGTVLLLLFYTFDSLWDSVSKKEILINDQFYASTIIAILATILLIVLITKRGIQRINPMGFSYVLFIVFFFIGRSNPALAQILANLAVLVIAVLTIKKGADQDSIFILNYGLFIMTALVICRFFDTNLSFVIRGILFIGLGLSFFGANYWMIKRRKIQL